MKRIWLVVALLVVGLWLVAACARPAPEKEVAPAAPVAPVLTEAPEATPASIARGGALYDTWWKVAEGASEPTTNHPLWATQRTNTRSGSATWTCNECHGWDYLGKDGAYAKGPRFTGFPGVYAAGTTKTKVQLMQIMMGGDDARHNFSAVMGEAELWDVVNFLSEGLIDETRYLDYAANRKDVIGADVAHGKELYTTTCAACHGPRGKDILYAGEGGLSIRAYSNPWKVLHSIRFGIPGTLMPSTVVDGWSMQDVVDVLGYVQTLP